MAAPNKTKFQVLRSATATSIPSPTILDVGELAINTADRRLYSKHTDGTVFQIGSEGVAEAPWVDITDDFNTVAGGKYLINSQNVPFGDFLEATLPENPSLGNVILFVDATGNYHNRPLRIKRNGSIIMGLAEDMLVNTRYAAFGLIYFDGPSGWRILEL